MDTRTSISALAVVAVLLLVGTSTATAVDEPSTDTTMVTVEGTTVAAENTTTIDVIVRSAPEGSTLVLSMTDGAIARFESATYAERYRSTTAPGLGDDGKTIWLPMADRQQSTVATVTLRGRAPGISEIDVELRRPDSDDATPAVDAGMIVVTPTETVPADRPGDFAAELAAADATNRFESQNIAGPGAAATGSNTTVAGAGPLSPLSALVALSVLALVAHARRL